MRITFRLLLALTLLTLTIAFAAPVLVGIIDTVDVIT